MLSGDLIYLLSPDLLNEYRDVLLRPKLTWLHQLQEPEIEQIMIELTANAIWREPLADREPPSPDPCDAHLWDLLASDPTAILITGYRLLLNTPRPPQLGHFPGNLLEHLLSPAKKGLIHPSLSLTAYSDN